MKLANNTPNEVFYGISCTGMADCGTIEAGGTSADLTGYDNQPSVRVTFQPTPVNQVTPFTIFIPETGTGMGVTIGISQE